MKSGTITGLLGGIIVAGFSLGAYGEIKENPYQVIIDRNPFGLRTPPPPLEVKPPEAPPPPPLEIKLTGITTLLGPPRALLEFTDPQTKKVDRPSPFEEGEKYKDNIEIVSIDADNQTVKVKIGEAMTTLDFVKNGIKPATASAAPVPHPGLPGVAAGVPPVPGAATVAGQQANVPYGTRSLVGGGTTASAASTYNPAVANSGVIPPRPVRTDTGVTIQNGSGAAIVSPGVGGQQYGGTTPGAPQQPAMSRDELIARLKAQREAFQQQNPSAVSIVPPIPGESQPVPTPTPVPNAPNFR